MADVKWIKITTDIFDDEKFCLIDAMPEADAIEVIWFKLLVFAGRSNNNGVFFFNDHLAYTDEMLASVFHRPLNTVRMALKTFEQLGMIEVIDGVYAIPNWTKYQSLDAYENKKIRDREYSKKRRAKMRTLIAQHGSYTPEEFENAKRIFDYKCAYCGKEADRLDADHVVPIESGGSTNINNIVPCCKHCNSSKGGKTIDEWYPKQDFFDNKRYEFIKEYIESAYSLPTVGRFCSYSLSNSKSLSLDINNIINYLNQRCNTKYRPSTKDTIIHIKARLKEGFTVEDFYTVIDKKADEWIGTDYEKFLRPQTLFCKNFESYLNQNIKPTKRKNDGEEDYDWDNI